MSSPTLVEKPSHIHVASNMTQSVVRNIRWGIGIWTIARKWHTFLYEVGTYNRRELLNLHADSPSHKIIT